MNYTGGTPDTKKPHQGNNIRKLRGLRQKSQKELADIIGVSPDTLRTWEHKAVLEPTELKKSVKRIICASCFY
ncbi:MAG: helix-turn-helix domain-containing protein [Tannerellaceae bacterium]|nr:helix-turn-helix domain-containing protein [Tannerellaceae bacterium]